MSKSDTVGRLIDSAILSFSRYGYDGTSLRWIAVDADMPLSAINLYFGSKSGLYTAVEKQIWTEIDNERRWIFQEILATKQGAPPLLGELIYVLALPIVRRALSKSEHETAQIYFIRSRVCEHRSVDVGSLLETADRLMVMRWIDMMALACPTLSRQQVIWAFSFIVGIIYSWQLIDHRYDRLLDANSDPTSLAEQGTRAGALRYVHALRE